MRQFVFCVGLIVALGSAAHARGRPTGVRLGIAIDAPEPMVHALEHRVVPQTQGHDMLVADKRRYMAMVDELGLLWPFAPASARRVGRALHLTHVAIFEFEQGPKRSGGQSILHVRLVDTRSGRVPVNKRFALPGGQLDAQTAQRMTEALRYMLLGERPGTRVDAGAAPSPLAQRVKKAPEPPTATPDVDGGDEQLPAAAQVPSVPKVLKVDADTGAQTDPPQDDSAHRARKARQIESRRQVRASFAIAFRKAQLSPEGAPCYCNNGSFAPPIVGARLATALFWDPNTTHFGLHLEAGLGVASLAVSAGEVTEQSRTLPWHVAGDVAYRLFETGAVTVTPRLGASYSRFPISSGSFFGTGYTTGFLGVLLESQPWGKYFMLRVGGDFHIIAHTGLEMARLGTFQNGVGWQVQLSPTWLLGAFRLGLEVRYGAVDTHFVGATALYNAARYLDVSLSDTTLDMQIQFGGALW